MALEENLGSHEQSCTNLFIKFMILTEDVAFCSSTESKVANFDGAQVGQIFDQDIC